MQQEALTLSSGSFLMAVASIQMGTAHVTLVCRPPSTDYKSVQNKRRLKGSRTPFTRHFCQPSFSVQKALWRLGEETKAKAFCHDLVLQPPAAVRPYQWSSSEEGMKRAGGRERRKGGAAGKFFRLGHRKQLDPPQVRD